MTESFIFQAEINHQVCDDILEYHKKSEQKKPGGFFKNEFFVDKNTKDSVDVILPKDTQIYHDYCVELQRILDLYILRFPSCNFYSPFSVIENINIQYYPPGGGYKVWHTERNGGPGVNMRHLVFMTYLNDVTDGGGTEFLNQNIVTTARKGKTLIWPADWTHTHRGVVSPTQEKYIITGWLNFTS